MFAAGHGGFTFTQLEVRSFGAILEIAGVVYIAIEIAGAREAVGIESDLARVRRAVAGSARRFWNRLLRRPPKVISLEARGTLTLSGKAEMTVVPGPPRAGASIEEQLDYFRGRLDSLALEAKSLQGRIDSERTARQADLAALDGHLREEVAGVRGVVERLNTASGLRLRWFAALVIAAGVALTTWPVGIARWLP
jgi:hypothetical protein